MLDYIVVGFGLSGLSFVEQLEKENKSYLVFDDFSQKSSRVAGGLYNPVILKRFTPAWHAVEQIKKAKTFYRRLEIKLQKSLVFELSVLRRFNSVEEQNTWFEACDKPILDQFLSPKLLQNTNPALDIPHSYGAVKHTGRIDIKNLLATYQYYLEQENRFINEPFDYDSLTIKDDFVVYKGHKSKHILFSEGYGVKNNPFFNYLPVVGNKGEYIIIKSADLKLKEAVKSSIFIIPLGDDLYKVGATYNNKDKSPETTDAAKEELIKKLERFLNVDYEIVDQVAGIRPTVKDRRPLIGTHPEYKNVHILNGLGSRGILIGPSVAESLYNYIEKATTLDNEIDIKRYKALR